MKDSLKTLFGLFVALLIISFSTNALCERLRGISNNDVAVPEYASTGLNEDDYAHIFRDNYGDYFYYNEVPSRQPEVRLFIGKWESKNTIYATTAMYNSKTGDTAVCAEYQDGTVFYYLLRSTSYNKYHTGDFTFLNFGEFYKRTWTAHITWTKGGY